MSRLPAPADTVPYTVHVRTSAHVCQLDGCDVADTRTADDVPGGIKWQDVWVGIERAPHYWFCCWAHVAAFAAQLADGEAAAEPSHALDLLGRAAYNAWSVVRNGTATPAWIDLEADEREAWRGAADAVRMMTEWQAQR